MNSKVLLSLIITVGILQSSLAQYEGYSSKNWKKQIEIEKEFLGHIDLNSFKKHLKKLTERPHVVGSKENEKVQNYMANVMKNAGFEVKNYPYDLYLPNKPGSSLIEIVTPSREILNQKEDIIISDLIPMILYSGKDGTHFLEVEISLQMLSMPIMDVKKILKN